MDTTYLTLKICKSVSVGEDGGIADKGFSLVPSKYIEFVNRDESVDYDIRMKELPILFFILINSKLTPKYRI